MFVTPPNFALALTLRAPRTRSSTHPSHADRVPAIVTSLSSAQERRLHAQMILCRLKAPNAAQQPVTATLLKSAAEQIPLVQQTRICRQRQFAAQQLVTVMLLSSALELVLRAQRIAT